jgi:transcriptional regulator GlxA family with amidase domain
MTTARIVHGRARGRDWQVCHSSRDSCQRCAAAPVKVLARVGSNRALWQGSAMHSVAVLAFDGVVAVDLTIPASTFGLVRLRDGRPGYRVKVCGPSRFVQADGFRLALDHGLSSLRSADTIIIPGVDHHERHVDPQILAELRRAAHRGARIASVCSGALVLARTGLLDGKRATTHWAAAAILQEQHPRIDVDPAVLYVDTGRILTSAGGMASLDLCLHMIRRDHGAAVAAASARLAVMPLERAGGQAQFILHEPPAAAQGDSLAPTLEWMERNLKKQLHVRAIARHAAMSDRTLARRFREQTGMTPAKWVASARVRHAQELLETTAIAVERVAAEVGFGSPMALRARFKETVGVSPLEYRRAFRSDAARARASKS